MRAQARPPHPPHTPPKQQLDEAPAVKATVQGDDLDAFCEVVRGQYKAQREHWAELEERSLERTIDAQRADATLPKDTVAVYRQLADIGLQCVAILHPVPCTLHPQRQFPKTRGDCCCYAVKGVVYR